MHHPQFRFFSCVGALINAVDDGGYTALHLAVTHELLDIAKLLIEKCVLSFSHCASFVSHALEAVMSI
jgi:ankyrin repeat protein